MSDAGSVSRKGNRAFSIVAGACFSLLFIWDFIDFIDLLGYGTDFYDVAYYFISMSIEIVLAVACFIGRKNLFTVIALGIHLLFVLVEPYAFSYAIFHGYYAFMLFAAGSLFAFALLGWLPKTARCIEWTKCVCYVPAALHFIAISLNWISISELIGSEYIWDFIIRSVPVQLFAALPSKLFLGLWLTSSDKQN